MKISNILCLSLLLPSLALAGGYTCDEAEELISEVNVIHDGCKITSTKKGYGNPGPARVGVVPGTGGLMSVGTRGKGSDLTVTEQSCPDGVNEIKRQMASAKYAISSFCNQKFNGFGTKYSELTDPVEDLKALASDLREAARH